MSGNVVTGRFGGPTVSKLIGTFGAWCGDEADVAHRGRRLREAGILPTGRRGGGRGAVEVDSSHCVALLLAFMATSNASRAADAFIDIRDLPYERITTIGADGETTVERAVDGGATDLSTLAADLAKIVEIYRAGRRLTHRNLHLIGIEVLRDTRSPAARLDLGSPDYGRASREAIHYIHPGHVRPRAVASFRVDGDVVQAFANLLGPVSRVAESNDAAPVDSTR